MLSSRLAARRSDVSSGSPAKAIEKAQLLVENLANQERCISLSRDELGCAKKPKRYLPLGFVDRYQGKIRQLFSGNSVILFIDGQLPAF
jgi:hypothetical protein